MCLSEPIELYTQNGCNLFHVCHASIKLILKGKKKRNGILVTEVTELRSEERDLWESILRLHCCPSKSAFAQNVADKEGLSPF